MAIAYGIDPAQFDVDNGKRDVMSQKIRTNFNIPKDNIVIGSIARLEPQKAQSYLIESAKIISSKRNDVTFVVVGGGRSEIEAQIAKKGMEKIFYYRVLLEISLSFCVRLIFL